MESRSNIDGTRASLKVQSGKWVVGEASSRRSFACATTSARPYSSPAAHTKSHSHLVTCIYSRVLSARLDAAQQHLLPERVERGKRRAATARRAALAWWPSKSSHCTFQQTLCGVPYL